MKILKDGEQAPLVHHCAKCKCVFIADWRDYINEYTWDEPIVKCPQCGEVCVKSSGEPYRRKKRRNRRDLEKAAEKILEGSAVTKRRMLGETENEEI